MDKTIDKTGDQSGLEERELIERCRSGQESAYEEFYREYSSKVYTLACRILGNTDWAKDATQEIFIKAFSGLTNFQYQSKISTWLYRIAVNQCRDMQRSQTRKREVSIESVSDNMESVSLLEQVENGKPSPSEEQHARQIRQKIIEAIERLPEEFRETIYLKEIEDLSYEEIGKIVGCRMGTVKSRIFRARELLQKELKDLYQEMIGGSVT